jgi:hypothetical protein
MIDWTKTVESVPRLKRGIVWCRECGASQKVNSAQCLTTGWPTCCGYTMTIDSPEETAHADRTRATATRLSVD